MKRIFMAAIALAFCQTSALCRDGKEGFAGHLAADGDAYRAIGVYKELGYFSEDKSVRLRSLWRISYLYHRSGYYRDSLKYAARLLDNEDASDKHKSAARILMGLNYYKMKSIPMAFSYFDDAAKNDKSGAAELYKIFVKAETAESGPRLRDELNVFVTKYKDAPTGKIASDMNGYLSTPSPLLKSPALAAGLSFAVPGAGQFYSEHYFDGLQAFLYVGVFAMATYAAYMYDSKYGNDYLNTYIGASITALFHASNIIGAWKTAEYRNWRKREDRAEGLRDIVFEKEPEEIIWNGVLP